MARMVGVGSCTLLLLSLSLTLLFRVAWSHPFGIPRRPMLGPFPPFSWAGNPSDHQPYNYYFLMHKRAGSDVDTHPKASPTDAWDFQPDSMERTTPVTSPGKPQAAEEDQQKRLKRPLDTVGSGFMKKARDEGKDSSKRQLDHVGIGLMKRRVDAPWRGPFKMKLHHSDANNFPAQSNDLDNGWSTKLREGKKPSVEAIKEGLEILEVEMISGDNKDTNLIYMTMEILQIISAYNLLSDGLGDGSLEKEIDLEKVRTGLDRLATILSQRGQDIGGFQTIKAALDILDRRMRKPSTSKISDNDGLAMLKKGLDQLATSLVKNGADMDNVNLIVTEAINLASWMTKHKPVKDLPPAAKDLDKMPEVEKKDDGDGDTDVNKKVDDDADSDFRKKAFDKLGSGFIKKGLDHVGSNLMKRFEDTDDNAEDHLLHNFGSGIITSAYENIAKDPHNAKFKTFVEELKKKAVDEKYAELKHSVKKEKPDNSMAKTAQKFPKDMKSEMNIMKPETKKSLDELGSGLMKKDLDYLGSGLIKKDVDYSDQQELFKKHSAHPDIQSKAEMKNNWSSKSGEGRTSAIEMIKKGLDVLGAGLFKRDRKGFPEIKAALHQLSSGLGDGSVDVDMEVMKRGLDHLGAEFLKRGLDTQGLYYIKRGLDTLRRQMTEPVSSKSSVNDGLGLLKKGLDNLALSLKTHGVDIDGLNLIVKGTVSLVNLVAKHQSDDHLSPSTGDLDKLELEKKDDDDADSDFSKKDDDDVHSDFTKKDDNDDDSDFSKKDDNGADSDVSKKALDKLGSGFIKKGLDHVGSNLMKRFDDFDRDVEEKYLDDFGSGFFINEYDDAAKILDHELMKEAVNKKYAEFMLSFEKNKQEDNKANSAQNFPNNVKLGVHDPKKPVPKKSLDELGSGLMKKDLDYLGSGLFKKDFHDPDSKKVNQNRL